MILGTLIGEGDPRQSKSKSKATALVQMWEWESLSLRGVPPRKDKVD